MKHPLISSWNNFKNLVPYTFSLKAGNLFFLKHGQFCKHVIGVAYWLQHTCTNTLEPANSNTNLPSGIWSHLPTASLMLTSAPFYISLIITVLASPLVAAGFYITVLASPFVTAGELTDIIYMHIYKWFSWLIKLWYYVISNSSTRVKILLLRPCSNINQWIEFMVSMDHMYFS